MPLKQIPGYPFVRKEHGTFAEKGRKAQDPYVLSKDK
jgi:hypothetical protein